MVTWTSDSLVPQSLDALEKFVFLTATLEIDAIQHQDFLQLLNVQIVQIGTVSVSTMCD